MRPGPGDVPEGACIIGEPFTADMVHDHLQDILPDGRKPAPLRRGQREVKDTGARERSKS